MPDLKLGAHRTGRRGSLIAAAVLAMATGCGSSDSSGDDLETDTDGSGSGSTQASSTSSTAGSSSASGTIGTAGTSGPPQTTDETQGASSDGGSTTGNDPAGVATTDDFNEDSLAEWSRLDPSAASARVENGTLVVEPADNSLWFNASTADFVYKETAGDFVLTAPVAVRSFTGGLPSPQFRLGGIMIRDPAPDAEDYVFLVLGADGDDLSTESKTTDDGQSTFWGPPWSAGQAELRVCRVGSSVQTLVREVGQGPWTILREIERPDLPNVIQFGALAYANAAPADLSVVFDSIRIQPISDLSECQA